MVMESSIRLGWSPITREERKFGEGLGSKEESRKDRDTRGHRLPHFLGLTIQHFGLLPGYEYFKPAKPRVPSMANLKPREGNRPPLQNVLILDTLKVRNGRAERAQQRGHLCFSSHRLRQPPQRRIRRFSDGTLCPPRRKNGPHELGCQAVCACQLGSLLVSSSFVRGRREKK